MGPLPHPFMRTPGEVEQGGGDSQGDSGDSQGDSLGISGGLACILGGSLPKWEHFLRFCGGLVRDHAGLL